MISSFDIDRFRRSTGSANQYSRQLKRLQAEKKEVRCIEAAVHGAAENLRQKKGTSFVIYGEPQSGKTEMMICLTGLLVDESHPIVLHLLNDSVDLLEQNLGRFKASGLAPAPRNYSEILDPAVQLSTGQHVIFCKKNAKDLQKILDKLAGTSDVVVIDDEADYASPNAKINQGQQTKINELITQILGSTGIYIGVTATPARLDLNNTFDNDSDLWIHFPPHSNYTGQDTFFPLEDEPAYRRTLLPDSGADPKYARDALFGFLVTVAFLNEIENDVEQNYSLLVHTSGKKADHKNDWGTMREALNALLDRDSKNFAKYTKAIWEMARDRYPEADPNRLTHYVLDNIPRHSLIILNSERDWSQNASAATDPTSLFTIIIGGNIVSRGVTLNNLVSMFFTRDVKHKIQQDTYIQRARMFGSRGSYLRHFELTMPDSLYWDWHRCFVFHRLALEAIRAGGGSLVWLSDSRISAVASSSIDRSTVDMNRGEMSFPLFPLNDATRELIDCLADDSTTTSTDKLERLSQIVGEGSLPRYVRRFITRTCPHGSDSIAVHKSLSIAGYKESLPDLDKAKITRRRGFIGKSQLEAGRFPHAIHHIRVLYNGEGFARVFYKFAGSIQFIKKNR